MIGELLVGAVGGAILTGWAAKSLMVAGAEELVRCRKECPQLPAQPPTNIPNPIPKSKTPNVGEITSSDVIDAMVQASTISPFTAPFGAAMEAAKTLIEADQRKPKVPSKPRAPKAAPKAKSPPKKEEKKEEKDMQATGFTSIGDIYDDTGAAPSPYPKPKFPQPPANPGDPYAMRRYGEQMKRYEFEMKAYRDAKAFDQRMRRTEQKINEDIRRSRSEAEINALRRKAAAARAAAAAAGPLARRRMEEQQQGVPPSGATAYFDQISRGAMDPGAQYLESYAPQFQQYAQQQPYPYPQPYAQMPMDFQAPPLAPMAPWQGAAQYMAPTFAPAPTYYPPELYGQLDPPGITIDDVVMSLLSGSNDTGESGEPDFGSVGRSGCPGACACSVT